jgi:hypothetical protein
LPLRHALVGEGSSFQPLIPSAVARRMMSDDSSMGASLIGDVSAMMNEHQRCNRVESVRNWFECKEV